MHVQNIYIYIYIYRYIEPHPVFFMDPGNWTYDTQQKIKNTYDLHLDGKHLILINGLQA